MSHALGSLFSEFLQRIEAELKTLSDATVVDWPDTLEKGLLTTFLQETITSIEASYSHYLQHSQRKSTLLASLYELVASTLIKTFLETYEEQKFTVILDSPLSNHCSHFSGKERPDLLIKKQGKVAGIIELKYKLKHTGYKAEKARRTKLLAAVPRYYILQYWEQEIGFVKSLLQDHCAWVQIVNPSKQLEQIQNSRRFSNPLHKQQACDRLDIPNAVELTINHFMSD